MQSRFFLNVVVRQGAAVLQLFASKDQALLIWRDAFLILNLCLDIVNRVAGLNIKSDGLAREGLDEDLHATAETQDQMQSRFFLNVVVRQGAAILQLFASKDQALLIWRDAFLILNL